MTLPPDSCHRLVVAYQNMPPWSAKFRALEALAQRCNKLPRQSRNTCFVASAPFTCGASQQTYSRYIAQNGGSE